MKKSVIFGCILTMFALAQEKTADRKISPSLIASGNAQERAASARFAPADIRILGDLDYGQTSDAVPPSPGPQYRAFVFNGHGGDRVEVTVTGANGKVFVAIADSSLTQVASGTTRLNVRLPYRGPDIEAWYIVFKELGNRPARLTVQLKKIESTSLEFQLGVPAVSSGNQTSTY